MKAYRSPQIEAGFELKRIIAVIAISFALLAVSRILISMKQSNPPSRGNAQQQQPVPVTAAANSKDSEGKVGVATQAEEEIETVVENDLYKVTFSNRGAMVTSWVLKLYKDERGHPLDLVNSLAAPRFGYPLSLWSQDKILREKMNTALYVVEANEGNLSSQTISFDYIDGDITVHKSFRFGATYEVGIQTSVLRNGAHVAAFPTWPSGFGDAVSQAGYSKQGIDYASARDLKRMSPDKKGKKLRNGDLISGPLDWAGALDQYFAAIFLPEKPHEAMLVTLQNSMDVPKSLTNLQADYVGVEVIGVGVGNSYGPTSERLFVGPKDLNLLGTVHPNGAGGQPNNDANLQGLVDFGIFSFVARPMFASLNWIEHKLVHNWGWAIIVLTACVNIVLLPLRLVSMRSSLKLQRIAPQIKQIQDKYKKYQLNDPRRAEQNSEIQVLYKQHGVNPAGGCLPLFIQMPFLIAFYSMLGSAFELRHAHWLWLSDLSSPDALFILPLLIVATMVLQQRMIPSSGTSPEQQRIVNFMSPVLAGVMSWSVGAGLGLYWLTGTIVGIVQQAVMNRTS